MSLAPLTTLKNGSRISTSRLNTIKKHIEDLHKKNEEVLCELFQKCNDPKRTFSLKDANTILKEHAFIDNKGNIDPEVRKVVLNGVEKYGIKMVLVNPKSPMIILNDGFEVAKIVVDTITATLQAVLEENKNALSALAQKCSNEKYKFSSADSEILKKHDLIDEKGNVKPGVRRIVLNSIEKSSNPFTLIDPVKKTK